jgi:YcxB-like protein
MEQLKFYSQMDFPAFVKANFILSYKRPAMIIMSILGVFMLIMAIPYYLETGEMKTLIWQLILGGYFLILLPLIIYLKSKKLFHSKSRLTERMEWTVDYEWIAIKGETFESKMTWDKVYKVLETKEMFLVYQSKLVANFISKSAMSAEQVQAFRKIVKGVLGLKSKLRTD